MSEGLGNTVAGKGAVLLLAAVAWVCGVAHAQTGSVKVDIYRAPADGAAPFSDLVDSFMTKEIKYGDSTGWQWFPLGMWRPFGAVFTGTLHVARGADYTFTLISNDGAELFINNRLIVGRGEVFCGRANMSGRTYLAAGQHPFRVEFYEDTGDASGVDLLLPLGISYGPPATLTVTAGTGGSVLSPGEGTFAVEPGTSVGIEAVPFDSLHQFSTWSGTAVDRGKVADPRAARTTVTVDANYTLSANFIVRPGGAAPGFSLGMLDFDDPAEYTGRVITNNAEEAVFVERVVDITPDSAGMMRLRLLDGDAARAKVRFGKCDADRVLVRFEYLFEWFDRVEIVVHLSDVPELLDPDDPQRARHYAEIGRVPIPPSGRPGAVNSQRFATFEAWAPVGSLDLSKGTWVELELAVVSSSQDNVAALADAGLFVAAAAAGGTGATNNLAVEVHCEGICLDLNRSNGVDEDDYMLVIASSGTTVALDPNTKDPNAKEARRCVDGAFSSDGYLDPYDIQAWDWTLKDPSRVDCKNLCRSPLPANEDDTFFAAAGMNLLAMSEASAVAPIHLDAAAAGRLLILGKSRYGKTFSDLLTDCLYRFDEQMACTGAYSAGGLPVRCNSRVVRGPTDDLYLVNTERGVLRIDGSVRPVVPPGKLTCTRDPRHQGEATVYVGIQSKGSDSFGRPILDAAIGPLGQVYVVPVVVQPPDEDTYMAAAQLELDATADPPYRLVTLYADPRSPADNQDLNHLREIEVDQTGTVYLLNAHYLNESCIVWKYAAGSWLMRYWRVDLQGPKCPIRIEDPLAMHISRDSQRLYLASGLCNPQAPDEAVVYALSADDGSVIDRIRIQGMQMVTSITDVPETGTVWVAGFTMPDLLAWKPGRGPFVPDSYGRFYVPMLAQVPLGDGIITAACLEDSAHKLALPTSIIWTGP